MEPESSTKESTWRARRHPVVIVRPGKVYANSPEDAERGIPLHQMDPIRENRDGMRFRQPANIAVPEEATSTSSTSSGGPLTPNSAADSSKLQGDKAQLKSNTEQA